MSKPNQPKTYQVGCLQFNKTNCWNCQEKRECDVYAYILDLTAVRGTCPSCLYRYSVEHANYCPFCGRRLIIK